MKAIAVVVSDMGIIIADILDVIVLLTIVIISSVIAIAIAIMEVCYVLKSFFVCIVVEWKPRRAPQCPWTAATPALIESPGGRTARSCSQPAAVVAIDVQDWVNMIVAMSIAAIVFTPTALEVCRSSS